MGLGLLTAQAGLAALSTLLSGPAFGGVLGAGGAVMAAMPVNWQRFLKHAGTQSELFAEFQKSPHAGVAAAAQTGGLLPKKELFPLRRLCNVC